LLPFLSVILISACVTSGSRSGLSLYDAIERSAEQIAENLPAGSRVAIVAFESENDNVSDYIMEELTGALFDRKIEVADRQNLEYVFQELNFQMSGEVSDETAKSIGKFLAADMVVTGQLLNLDSMYRYRASAINVETAVRASVTRLDIRSDSTTRRIVEAIGRQHTTTKVAKYGVSADVTPQTAGTFLDRGIMFASRGEFEMAVMDFDEAIKINPNMSAAYALRGRALFASVSKIISIGENFSGVSSFSNHEKATVEQRRILEQAVADFTQAIRLDPNNANFYIERGSTYSGMGDFDRTIADYTQAIRLNPNNATAYSNRGLTYSEIGDLDRAITDFNEAIRLDPNYDSAYDGRGGVYLFKREYDKAIADYSRVIQLNPNFAEAYETRGIAYLFKGDNDRAIIDFTHVIRLKPNFANSYWARGRAYHNKGDLDRAITDYEAALQIDPNHDAGRQHIEQARKARGR